jgi:hypothetical protein
VLLEELGQLKKFSGLIGNPTRDLPTCSKVLNQLRYRVPPEKKLSVLDLLFSWR